MQSPKIKELQQLAPKLREERSRGRKIALCHGVFDLVHIGHVRHFKEARELADLLVVSVTPDRFVNKGPGRPVFSEALRAENVAALEIVDYVAVNQWPTATETIQLLKPDFYVKGSEYRNAEDDVTGKIGDEAAAVQAVGGQIVFTDDIVFSSSALLNEHMPSVPSGVTDFLKEHKGSLSFQEIVDRFETARRAKVLLIGESILDEYVYCETMGKSGKEPILAARYLSEERHAGGVLAIANHLAAFCESVSLMSQLGDRPADDEFVRQRLAPNVRSDFLRLRGGPTIIKRRFVESYPFQKLFEIYLMNDEQEPDERKALAQALERPLAEADVVIVADYGHGMLEGEIIDLICSRARFLAVNTQKNAGNHGFNTVSKYRRADFVSVSAAELLLDARTKRTPIQTLMCGVAGKLGASRVIVTMGGLGCLSLDPPGVLSVPALSSHVKDRIGAGDAVFAATSLLAWAGASGALIGLVGNAVGAQAVGIIGNRSAIDRVALLKHLQHLLK